ncbi:MAG: tRNA pseudouridine(55) synthase TruB [Oscillospiraceae bacterium]|nr:tRNA pseudouridine(55) synthase TruB [Oscillospiraceae bacterium]
MDGVLNVLKPAGMTSFDVVAYLRRLMNIKKIGHCGTLDPAATGVLPICTGLATGISEYLGDMRKSYRAEVLFGVMTDSLDTEGAVIRAKRTPSPERADIEPVLQGFVGRQLQEPPMFSAVKVGGRRLYELARKGVEVQRAPREITVYDVRLIRVLRNRIVVDIECSKGVYIRSLCGDIGKRLGVDACMSFLIRTSAAGFGIKDAFTLEDLEKLLIEGRLNEAIMKIDDALPAFACCSLTKKQLNRFLNGQDIELGEIENVTHPNEADNATRPSKVDCAARSNEAYNVTRPSEGDRSARSSEGDRSVRPNDISKVYKVYSENTFYALGAALPRGGRDVLRLKKLLRKGEPIT